MTETTPVLADLTKRELLELCAQHDPPIAADRSMNNDAIMALLLREPEDREGAPADEAAEPESPLPTRGLMVDYHSAVKTYPAVVCAAYPTRVLDLVIFGQHSLSSNWRQSVREGTPGTNNTWAWPERED